MITAYGQAILHFGDEERAQLWMRTPNALLEGQSPNDLVVRGNEARLLDFIRTRLRNLKPVIDPP